MWHASIGIRFGEEPVMVAAWSTSATMLVWRQAEHLLRGVGAGETFRKPGTFVVHLRRSLSPRELETINQDWLAIPAIDVAG